MVWRFLPILMIGGLAWTSSSLLSPQVVGAAPPVATPPAEAKPEGEIQAQARQDDVAEWIRQLDADRFADRQTAHEKLAAAGGRAIPALSEAAESGSAEATARSINILAEHLARSDVETKAAARAALDKLASSKNAAAARRAKSALQEADKPQPIAQNPAALPFRIAGNRIFQIQGGAQIQIQVQQNAGQGQRVQIAQANGVKTIEAEEAGRKVKIKDDPQNGIDMEITETKDGKPVTQKFQAKNAEELKKKAPEAHKLYEQYSQQNRLQIRAPVNGMQRMAEIQIQSIQRSADSLQRTIDRLENDLGKERAKEVRKHLDNMKKELEAAQRKLTEEDAKQKIAEQAPEKVQE